MFIMQSQDVFRTAEASSPTLRLAQTSLLGVNIRCGAPQECVRFIDSEITRGGPLKLGFVNAHTAYLTKSEDYRSTLSEFLLLNDGVALDLMRTITFGAPFPFNLNGTDFVPFYLHTTAMAHRVYLLGARPGIADEVRARWTVAYPQHAFVGSHHGYFSAEENEGIVQEMRDLGVTLVIVALGNPLQEQWISSNIASADVRLAIGAGALLDFASGKMARAPGWMRTLRLEWLYRLACEPRRLWQRYVIQTPSVLWRAHRERSQQRRGA